MDLTIFPYDGVGPIKLGMTQAEIRAVIGGEYKVLMKHPFAEMSADEVIGRGIIIDYRKPGICKSIELRSSAIPTFRGYRLMNLPFGPLAAYFQREDPSVKMRDDGLISLAFGICLYVPDLNHGPESPVEAVLVFEKGYWDKPIIAS